MPISLYLQLRRSLLGVVRRFHLILAEVKGERRAKRGETCAGEAGFRFDGVLPNLLLACRSCLLAYCRDGFTPACGGRGREEECWLMYQAMDFCTSHDAGRRPAHPGDHAGREALAAGTEYSRVAFAALASHRMWPNGAGRRPAHPGDHAGRGALAVGTG